MAVWLIAELITVGSAKVVDVVGGDHFGHDDVS